MPNRFGLGWNISDILGGLGDAISVGAGGDANYLNQVQRDRYGAGLDQFLGGDEQGGLRSLAQSGGPTAANQFYDNFGTNQYRKAVAANQAEDNRRQAQVEADKRDAATEARIAGIFRGATAGDWQQRRQIAQQYAQARGYDTTRLNIPEQYKEGWATDLDRSLLTPKDYADDTRQQQQVEETGRHNRASESNVRRGQDINDANADATRTQNRILQSGRLQVQGINADRQEDARRRSSAQAAENERGRNQRAATARADRAIARIIKDNPGARVQKNSTTGAVRFSTDGGKTWQQAN